PRRSRTSAGRREPGAPRRWSCPPARYRSCPAGRLLLRLELDRNRVDAVAQPGGVRPVVEDMAQVATALRTRHFGPHHEVAGVDVLLDGGGRRRLIEARPAAVGVELGLRDEQLRPAPGAAVNAWRAGVPVLARERPLGALLAQHLVLLRAQLPPPFRFGLLDFLAHLAPLTPVWGSPSLRPRHLPDGDQTGHIDGRNDAHQLPLVEYQHSVLDRGPDSLDQAGKGLVRAGRRDL